MTTDEKLDLLLKELTSVKLDMSSMKSDMSNMTQDVSGIKTDLCDLKAEISGLKDMDEMTLKEISRVHELMVEKTNDIQKQIS